MEDGYFDCAGCNTPLYHNRARFNAGCGWPCFFTCLQGTVRERRDGDGSRMELICNACNGHLGHVFRGERWPLPPPAERHCVNARSLIFRSAPMEDADDDISDDHADDHADDDGEEAEEAEGVDRWDRLDDDLNDCD